MVFLEREIRVEATMNHCKVSEDSKSLLKF